MSEEKAQDVQKEEQNDVKDPGPQPAPVQNLRERVPAYLYVDALRKLRSLENAVRAYEQMLMESNELHEVKNVNLQALEQENFQLRVMLNEQKVAKTDNK